MRITFQNHIANVWRLAGPILEASSAKIGTSHGFIYAWLDVLASYIQLTT